MSSRHDTAEVWAKRWWDLFPYARHGGKCVWPKPGEAYNPNALRHCECGLAELAFEAIINDDPLTPEEIAFGRKVADEMGL